jgi:cytochrome c-L
MATYLEARPVQAAAQLRLMRRLAVSTLLCAIAVGAVGAGPLAGEDATSATNGGIELLHVLDNRPIELTFRSDQIITPAVERFHASGENLYKGDAAAIAAGEQLFRRWCRSCHLTDGSGAIGPNLTDDNWRYPRTATDQGKFEIIYAGGAGAMLAFGRRLDQDDILKIIAFVDTLSHD